METNHKTIFDHFSLYFLAIFISPILFGSFMALYLMTDHQESWDYGSAILAAGFLSWPFFGFIAFPLSLYIDFSARMKNYPNKVKALLLAGLGGLAGLVAGIIYYAYGHFPMILMFLFGMVGGVIHFLVLLVLKKIIK